MNIEPTCTSTGSLMGNLTPDSVLMAESVVSDVADATAVITRSSSGGNRPSYPVGMFVLSGPGRRMQPTCLDENDVPEPVAVVVPFVVIVPV